MDNYFNRRCEVTAVDYRDLCCVNPDNAIYQCAPGTIKMTFGNLRRQQPGQEQLAVSSRWKFNTMDKSFQALLWTCQNQNH